MIKFETIEFKNYRQYKDFNISFESSDETKSSLFILKAKNGTGKTTFLNAILWCLYGKEFYLNDKEKALPILNESVRKNMNAGEKETVSVSVTITDGTKRITFHRTKIYSVVKDTRNNQTKLIEGSIEFDVSITETKYLDSNTNVYSDTAKTSAIVKEYFDEEIFDYYFFDGENLKSYFSSFSKKKDRVEISVKNIAQVQLLENVENHLNDYSQEKNRKANYLSDVDEKLVEEYHEILGYIENARQNIKKYEEINLRLQEEIKEIDEYLHSVTPIKINIEKRDRLEKELKQIEFNLDELKNHRNQFIIKYTILLNYYKYLKAAYNTIHEKENNGKTDLNVDRDLLNRILAKNEKKCPICNSHLTDDIIQYIVSLVEKGSFSSQVLRKLAEIKYPIETYLNDFNKFESEFKKIATRESLLNEQKEETWKELAQISAFLTKYSSEETKDISEYEHRRKQKREEININNTTIGSHIANIKIKEERKETLERNIQKNQNDFLERQKLIKQVRLLRKIFSNLSLIREEISTEIRKEIEFNTWEIFDSMIWKTKTFKKLTINKDYSISVYNIYDTEITGSMSATELMALAYAYTFAIHKASGKNCPLIVDSPLGRVSDENRTHIATNLLKISKEKQIIMLFTPDEYSDQVANVFKNEAAFVKEIILSSSEQFVEGTK